MLFYDEAKGVSGVLAGTSLSVNVEDKNLAFMLHTGFAAPLTTVRSQLELAVNSFKSSIAR